MDSLKLDRFRKLLNRQSTSISINSEHANQQQQQPAASSLPTSCGSQSLTSKTVTSNTTNIVSSPSLSLLTKSAANTTATATQASVLAITASLPDYVTKDNPRPALFIARKLFSDFTELANKKIEFILTRRHELQKLQQQNCHHHNQQQRFKADEQLFKSFQRDEDLIYDQILKALGAISEYCLPSLLELLLLWHDLQLEAYSETANLQHPNGANDTSLSNKNAPQQHQDATISLNIPQQQQQQDQLQSAASDKQQAAECGCISPCNDESHSLNNSTNLSSNPAIRSPTPSSPDISANNQQQSSIISALHLDYQSPVPLTTIIQKDKDDVNQLSSSAANTSASTGTNTSLNSTTLEDSTNLIRRLELTKTRALMIEYVFCQALTEIFSKLYLHPGYEDLIERVGDIAFSHFKHIEEQELNGAILSDIKKLADRYAEVIGILAQTRFRFIKKRFFKELKEIQANEPTPFNIQCICTLLTSMKYFRVKMAPIEEFEASFSFLQELADYFVEVRHKSIKHALADLFVEILLPVAAIVKNEVKIPCLKNFVECLWAPTLDMCARKKHSSTLFPLVTCLLCVSQRTLFLQNWGPFLTMCLSNLKNRDQKMCRIALESLYRLIWIYMIRVRGESNNITQARLNTIVDSIFPRGSRQIVPRDTPLIIFVDIIQFIAQERLDFALKHIIFDLLSVDRSIKMIMAPERMNIGLQAFLVIADNLQQKEGDSTMPITIGSASAQQLALIMQSNINPPPSPSLSLNNNSQHEFSAYGQRRAHAHRMLNDDTAKSIGLHPYYNHIQKSFNEILKILDAQFGRPLMLTSSQTTNKELDDMITADRKPKVDLFKTCIVAIPRLMPDGMSKADLIDLLSRMTIHIDEEMRRYAFESLKILVTEFQDWRLDAIEGFTLFLANQIDESLRHLVDSALKMLLQLLIGWHAVITSSSSSASSSGSDSTKPPCIVTIQTGYETISTRNSGAGGQIAARKNRALAEMRLIQSELSNTRFDRLVNVIQKVEGASLVMLCSCHSTTRKLASLLLRECRSIMRCYSSWTCMEQFGFRSPDDGEEEDVSVSMKGSLSADNLSRITTTSINGLVHSSMTSMNTQAMISTSISKMCISASSQAVSSSTFPASSGGTINNNNNNNNNNHQHDLYDEDIENNLADCYSSDENSTLIFWVAIMMLDSDKETEYTFALRLLRKILPTLPFEQQDFLDELDKNLKQMQWTDYPGIHALVLKGCASPVTYDLCISLLDHMTPILRHYICTAANKPEDCLPFHVLVLATYLLSTYEDPSPFSLNIARRLALCCEENSSKLENLSAVMTLYSRRSFSKDAFQWIKCIAKYLNDACPHILPEAITFLIDLLEGGPQHVQRLILPILYCILTYVDINVQPSAASFNSDIMRVYSKCLESTHMWRDALQIFKLIISKSSSLANNSTTSQRHELPGRTMDFTIDIESLPIITDSQLAELGILPNASSTSQQQQQQQQQSSKQQQQQQQQQQQHQPHSLIDSQA